MIPGPILAALAPVVADYVTGKVKRKEGEEPSLIETAVDAMFVHEKKKASVRPLMMKLTGYTSVMVACAATYAAMAPMFPWTQVDLETSSAVVENLLWVFGGTGGAYTAFHGVRAVEKSQGAA